MMYIFILCSAVLAVCYAGEIEVQNCEGITNKVSNVKVQVPDVPDGSNCTLFKGITYYLHTTFTPDENFPVVKMRALGVMGIATLPYMEYSNVCPEATTEDGENCDPEVGLVAGTSYTHVKQFPIRQIYPEMNMKARVEYFKHRKPTRRNVIFCYEVPIKIERNPDDENEVESS